MYLCNICGGQNTKERVKELGYLHCTKQSCVNTWRQRRIADEGLALVTMHKQGPAWVKRDEVPKNSMKRDNG